MNERPPRLWRGDDDLVHYVEAASWLAVYCTGDTLAQPVRNRGFRSLETVPTCLPCMAAR